MSDTIVAPWSYELTAGENPVYPITNQSAYMIGGTKGSLQFPNLKYWFYKKERSWWNKIFVNEDKIKKDDNVNLIHVGICSVLEPYGFYCFDFIDDDGWPHFELVESLPVLKPGEQSLLIKTAIVDYFLRRGVIS